MKRILSGIFLSTILVFVLTTNALAHSGCCSWHGGVRSDGCGCNDGTPLSSTCAPYYTCTNPQQNTAPANTNDNTSTYTAPAYVVPTDTPVPPTATPIPPTATPTSTPTPTILPTPTSKPTEKPKPTAVVLGTTTNNSGTTGEGLIASTVLLGIIGGIGFGVFKLSKNLFRK